MRLELLPGRELRCRRLEDGSHLHPWSSQVCWRPDTEYTSEDIIITHTLSCTLTNLKHIYLYLVSLTPVVQCFFKHVSNISQKLWYMHLILCVVLTTGRELTPRTLFVPPSLALILRRMLPTVGGAHLDTLPSWTHWVTTFTSRSPTFFTRAETSYKLVTDGWSNQTTISCVACHIGKNSIIAEKGFMRLVIYKCVSS